MKKFITIVIGILFVSTAYAGSDQGFSDKRLEEDGNQTTENYYLSREEKNARLSGAWKNYDINSNQAKVQYPWQPDKYELPGIPRSNGAPCSNVAFVADRGDDIALMTHLITCHGAISDYEAKKRLKGALDGILRNNRKLLESDSIDISAGYGTRGIVQHTSGNITVFLMISVKDSTYSISVTGSDSSAFRDYANRFITSFSLDGYGWQYDTHKNH